MRDYAGRTPGPWLQDGRTVYALNNRGTNSMLVSVQRSVGDMDDENTQLANARLIADAPDLLAQRDQLQSSVNNAYRDRAILVSVLTKIWPSQLEPGTKEGEWAVVHIEGPTGQLGWHIAPDDMNLFDHVPRGQNTWDGHDTAEKNRRLQAIPHINAQLDRLKVIIREIAESHDKYDELVIAEAPFSEIVDADVRKITAIDMAREEDAGR